MVVCYYRSRHLPKDYEPIPDQDSNWESPSEDSDYEDDVDIDGPTHIEDYLEWWRGRSPHYIGIHGTDLGEDEEAHEGEGEEVRENIGDTQDWWDAPLTSSVWDGECSLAYAYDESLDVGHDNNEETDPHQDEYEPELTEDVDDADDDDEDDDDGSFLILQFPYDFLYFLHHAKD